MKVEDAGSMYINLNKHCQIHNGTESLVLLTKQIPPKTPALISTWPLYKIIVTVKVKEQDMAESFLHVVWRFPNQSKPAGIEVDVDKLANGCFWVY